jgi:hypothetical protein
MVQQSKARVECDFVVLQAVVVGVDLVYEIEEGSVGELGGIQ